MPIERIRDLFERGIDRRIEEVIKVDQNDEGILLDEIEEYVVTDAIRHYYAAILDRYWETPNKPHEGIAVWISGFFGSGKSSFAKLLGLVLENRKIRKQSAGELFGKRTRDPRIQVLLRNIPERIPTEVVTFDLSTDRGIRTGQMLTEIMYRAFLQHLGYARDLDLGELEITLEEQGRLDAFTKTYTRLFGLNWDHEKGKVAIALNHASRVMQELEPKTYPAADSWVKAAKSRADISPNLLAERCAALMKRRRPDKNLVFVIDEAGQFVARDVQKMLDLQGVVQALGRVGRGRMWVVVTSQERLGELVGGLDDRRVELARLMDRFPQELQVHLETSDIAEVTSQRVLSKKAEAEQLLRRLFEENRGRLANNTRMTADIRLPELTADSFIALYPLMPYQVELIIRVVSGLRTRGGVTQHVGGANRTVIKLAQQLLINPATGLADETIGKLVRLDQVYDLVKGNIDSEIRDKIDHIKDEVTPFAQRVAKAIYLLQCAQSVHRTAENIAAVLQPAIDADSQLSAVNEALAALEKARKVRRGDDGFRIPTPAEDDWENQRLGFQPKPGDVNRILGETAECLWQPTPEHNFLGVKVFKAGLHLNGRERIRGDITLQVFLADAGKDYDSRVDEARRRSQTEAKDIFWAVPLDNEIDLETVEVFRSQQIIHLKERQADTGPQQALVSEEKRRLSTHQDELKRRLRAAMLNGAIFFRGNDRSPSDSADDVGKTASGLLEVALPEVYDRFAEAAARVQKADLQSLLASESLHGLTPLFTSLHLLKDERGTPVFNLDGGPLAEVLKKIENQFAYGMVAAGKYLEQEFGKEPFGWEFESVRLFVLCLLRAGKIDVTSGGQSIESALSVEAKNIFTNNNLYRQASFRPKQVGVTFEDLVKANEAFKTVFGRDLPELEAGAVAQEIKTAVGGCEEGIREAHNLLVAQRLPGIDVLAAALEQTKAIRTATQDNTILTFIGSHAEIKEAIQRAGELSRTLTPPALRDLSRAKGALESMWPFLEKESDVGEELIAKAAELKDILQRETFFRQLPAIDEAARAIEGAYKERFDAAVSRRAEVYRQAVEKLRAEPGWEGLKPDQQTAIAQPLGARATTDVEPRTPILQLRAEIDACPKLLADAIAQLHGIVDGNRIVRVTAANYFVGGVETEEQLDTAIDGLRQDCLGHIGAGKKILFQ